jgi:hypothetical protein
MFGVAAQAVNHDVVGFALDTVEEGGERYASPVGAQLRLHRQVRVVRRGNLVPLTKYPGKGVLQYESDRSEAPGPGNGWDDRSSSDLKPASAGNDIPVQHSTSGQFGSRFRG